MNLQFNSHKNAIRASCRNPRKIAKGISVGMFEEIFGVILGETSWDTLGGERIYWESLEEFLEKSFNRVPKGFFLKSSGGFF